MRFIACRQEKQTYFVRPCDLFRGDLRQSDMVKLPLFDEARECTHLVLDVVLLVYTGNLEVVQLLRAAEFRDDAVDAQSEVVWTGNIYMLKRGDSKRPTIVVKSTHDASSSSFSGLEPP